MEERLYGDLLVTIHASNADAGRAAAEHLTTIIRNEVDRSGSAAIVLATGNSQLTFYEAIRASRNVSWNKVTVFHLDEYIGICEQHPASFRRYMREQLVDAVHPYMFHGIMADIADTDAEVARYGQLLADHRLVACVMGVGENGHLGFNDPPADFETKASIHAVTLTESCRLQQVGEGHFAELTEVPARALSLTIRELLKPSHVLVVAPELRKAKAIKATLEGPVSPLCPASILRTCPRAHLYLDSASASLLG